jgi:hypothetical protein
MKKLIILLFCLVSSSAMAQQWIALGGTSYNQYYVQENSLRISKNNGNDILAMTVQTVNRINNNIVYNNVVVSSASCRQQQGTVTSYSLDGRKSINNVFALGGKDAPSLAATAICGTYHNYTISQPAQAVKESPNINLNNNAENNWHQIAINEKSEIALKVDSFTLVKTKSGEDAIMVTGRNIDQKSKKIALVTWSVTKNDCAKQQGKLTTINIDGKDSYDNNFVFGSGSLGSIISESICSFKS